MRLWKEVLGLNSLNDYEVMKRIQEARARKIEEVEFLLDDGEKVRIKLNYSNPEGILGSDALGW